MVRHRWWTRRERPRAGYQGPDRRARGAPRTTRSERSWLVVGAATVLLLVTNLALTFSSTFDPTSPAAMAAIRTAALVLALVLALTALLHWRTTGEAAAMRIGAAGWLFVGISALDLGTRTATQLDSVAVLRSAVVLAAAIWVARAAAGPEIDSTVTPWSDLVGALTVAGVFVASSVGLALLAGVDDRLLTVTVHAVTAAAWGVTATISLRRSIAGAPLLVGWTAWLGVTMTLAELARIAALAVQPSWLYAGAAAGAIGLLVAALGGVYGLAASGIGRRQHLHLADLRTRELHDHQASARRSQVHEVGNTLFALEGAISTLLRHRDRLPPDEQAQLQETVRAGLDQLRSQLVPVAPGGAQAVEVVKVVREQASLARSRGLRVEVAGDEPLRADCPQPLLRQVLANLLTNTERHAGPRGDASVQIRVQAHGSSHLHVRVRDHGPGIPRAQQQAVFEAGVRLHPDRPGDGLGLHVSRQLVRQHGGDLWVEEPPDGGACFVIELPTTTDARSQVTALGSDRVRTAVGRRPDVGHDGRQVVESSRLPRR